MLTAGVGAVAKLGVILLFTFHSLFTFKHRQK